MTLHVRQHVRQSTSKRQALWDREAMNAYLDDLPYCPICNLCGLQVQPGQDWDESHGPVAKAFGGRRTQIAHKRCNREDGAMVTRAVAKSDRVRARHTGAFRPRRPLPGGRNDPRKRTMSGNVVNRATGASWRTGS